MKDFWNKKRIELLLSADPATLAALWEQFGPVLYTWMYYQVGADQQIATDLTGKTFEQAIRNLSQFNFDQKSLYQWLKQQAKQVRDQGLEQLQMKPQRPWAWSQLPEEVFKSLSLLRSEPLPEHVLSNPFIQEIVQAALSELEAPDRQLLMIRYHRLDTEGRIADEMHCGTEEVKNRLYRSRHSFRRCLFGLMSSALSGFRETNAAGDTEILDSNLEKLLSTTAMYQSLDQVQTDTIQKHIKETAEEIAQSQPAGRNTKMNYRAKIITAGVLVILIMLAGFYHALHRKAETAPQVPSIAVTKETKPKSQTELSIPRLEQPSEDNIDEEELKLVFALGQARNIDALLEILKSGRFSSQLAAAHFLGQFAGPEAIEPLEQAEQQWYPEAEDDNAFAKAISNILSRHPNLIPDVDVNDVQQPPQQSQPTEQPVTPPLARPQITGIIKDFSDHPITNAVVELAENGLFFGPRSPRIIATTKTDQTGQYQLPGNYEGPAYITITLPGPEANKLTRSIWCEKESTRNLNPAGRPALTGTIMIDNSPIANQTLYLCDTFNLDLASFRQETVTDSEGNFTFLGVPAGTYLLMNLGLDKRIHRLTTFEMPQQDVFNLYVDIETAGVILEYPSDSQLPAPLNAELVYVINLSDDMNRYQATISEDGVVYFENVRPGSYFLRVQLEQGIWLQQDVEVLSGPGDQTVLLESIPEETAITTGRFLDISPVDLFLTNANQRIHIDITPQADGAYEITSIPVDVYDLAAFVNGQLVEFKQVDLQDQVQTLDIDPAELTLSFSPLYVVVTDDVGSLLSGAQVWLTGNEQIITSSSTGKGAFLPAPASDFTLSVAYPGYTTENRNVEIQSSSLLAEPDQTNTVLVQLGTQESQTTQ